MRVSSALSILAVMTITALAGPALAQGDPAEGEKVFRKCRACHAVEPGQNKVGPTLHGVVGRSAAAVDGYNYSKAMEEYGAAGHVWDDETLSAYLEAPRKAVQGTKMAFAGLRKEEEREDVIAYLKQFAE